MYFAIIKRRRGLYIESMKKLRVLALLPVFALIPLCACSKKVDYYSSVSEYRHDIYLYEEDKMSLKIYLSEKETPYNCDGVKGEMSSVCEVYYFAENTPGEVELDLCGMGGEMSYLSVSRSFYLSFDCKESFGAKASVNLTIDGKQTTIEANNVREEGTIDGATALKCVTEYDGEQFEKLTKNGAFCGEIGIRLLYDEGCYYYVGVIDREGKTHAYLLDASDGKIISERELDS